MYTKGKWKLYEKKDSYSIHGEDCLIIEIKKCPVVFKGTWLRQLADAQLIASAPELLEACKEALKDLQVFCDATNKSVTMKSMIRLKQSINKAEGTTT